MESREPLLSVGEVASWLAGVERLRKKHLLYPAWKWPGETNELMWRRVALLFNGLFEEISGGSPKNFLKTFFLFAREYQLYCDGPVDGEESFKDIPLGYYERFWGSENEDSPEMIKLTRCALDLSIKTVEEVPTGVDSDYLVDFLKFLYKHCPTGYLNIFVYLTPFVISNPYFFDRKNFLDVALFIARCLSLPKRNRPIGFSFSKSLFSAQEYTGENMIACPCLFMRIESVLPDLDERFRLFNVQPSIKLFALPQVIDFFWLLKSPVDYRETERVVDAQLKIAKLIHGNVSRAGFSQCTYLPGIFHHNVVPSHFMSYQLFDHEYCLEDFEHLPDIPESEYNDAWDYLLLNTMADKNSSPAPSKYFSVVKLEDSFRF